MNRTTAIALALTLVASTLATGPSVAQQDADIAALDQFAAQLKGDLTRKRDSALKQMVDLEGDQSKAFSKIVREYDKEMKKVRKARMELYRDFIRTREALDSDTAADLAQRAFTNAEARTSVRKSYFDRVASEISPVVAVQFLQLQMQFETMADAKLSAAMPLAGH